MADILGLVKYSGVLPNTNQASYSVHDRPNQPSKGLILSSSSVSPDPPELRILAQAISSWSMVLYTLLGSPHAGSYPTSLGMS